MTYSSEVLADSPLAYWEFDETSGSTITDSSGNGRNGTYSGTPVLGEPGLYTGDGGAARATSGLLGSVADAAWMDPTVGITAEVWFKAENATSARGIFSRYQSGAGSWAIWQNLSRVGLVYYSGSGNLEMRGPVLTAGKTYHVVATMSPTEHRLYVNGRQVASRTVSTTLAAMATANAVQFGGYSSTGFSLATLSGAALYDAILTPDRILAHYLAGGTTRVDDYALEVYTDSPAGHWGLDETSGAVVDYVARVATNDPMASTTGAYSGSPTLGQPALLGSGEGTAVAFDGVDDFADMGTAFALPATAQYTATALFSTSTSTAGAVITRASSSGSNRFQISVESGAIIGRNINTAVTLTSPASTYADGVTHHVALVQDATHLRLYVDGSEVANASSSNSSGTDNQFFRIGRGQYGGWSGYFTGTIDEVALYSTALSAARIEAHYDAAVAAPSSSIAGALNVTDHADAVTISGTVSAAPVTGTLSVTDHADEVTLTGTLAGPIVGTLTVVDHADLVTLAGDVTGVGGAVTGLLSVVDHADVAKFEVQNLGELDDIDTRPVRVSVAPRLHTVPVPAPIPASLASNVKPVVRVSHVAPAVTAANAPLTEGVDYPLVSPVVVGYERFFVDGIDRTYWRDTPVIISRLSSSTPLGYSAASIEIPAMHPWEKPGEGDLAWLRPDAPVVVALVDESDEIIEVLWSGFISKDSADLGEGRKALGVTCDGITWQAGYAQHEPPHYMPPTDIGTVVPDLLNSVVGKRYGDIPRVTTGILTRTRGSSTQKKAQVANEILQKEGWTLDGRQWTIDEVAPDEYRMVLKAPASTVHATVTYGAFGVDVNLERDQASRIDLIYGVGNAPGGGQWRGTRFPGLVIATPPPYPNDDARSMHLGDTDADTDSGSGISDMQARLVELGYALDVVGVLNADDIDTIRRIQSRMGALVDGVPGPQTWSAIFNRGPEGIDLTQWREPLAALPWTQEHYRDPNGIILAENPSYADTAKVQHQVEIHYGENITWDGAKPLAEKLLNVESTPALTGQIALTTDPHEMSRRHLKAGMNVKVVGFQGADVVLRIARMDMEADGRVILAVDERGRDALTVEQIRARDLAAMADPVRRPGNPNRESRIARDRYVQWDIDSPCGFMPRTAVFGGLWVCPNPIPFAEVGRVVKTMLRSTVPFALALFGLPVKPSQLHAIVGNPLASADPYRPHTDALDALGWIEAWGSQGDACGFSPGQESQGYPFSGEFVEIGGFDFISGRPPYVWPALFSESTGFIGGAEAGGWGRFYPDTAA